MISLAKWKILTTLQKLPKNVGYLGKIIVAAGFEKLPKWNKSPNLVTLIIVIITTATDHDHAPTSPTRCSDFGSGNQKRGAEELYQNEFLITLITDSF